MKYEYGVEYETNGKKPDLPKDLRFKVTGKMIGGNAYQSEFVVDECDWRDAITFCITDKRYKPDSELAKQGQEICDKIEEKLSIVDNSLNWYDYDKQEPIALPPVGVECEYISSFFGTKKHYSGTCKVIAYYQEKVWIDVVGYDDFVIHTGLIKFRPLDWNRKAKEERDSAVCAAFKSLTISNGDLAYKICQDLYDNGYLKNKAAP